jgi:hypothetical protein
MQASDLRKRATTVDSALTCGFLGAPTAPDIHALVFSLSPAPQHHRGGPR